MIGIFFGMSTCSFRVCVLLNLLSIGPWTWMVPILLALLACGFGILANFHPKMEMAREPRGKFGEMLDKVNF